MFVIKVSDGFVGRWDGMVVKRSEARRMKDYRQAVRLANILTTDGVVVPASEKKNIYIVTLRHLKGEETRIIDAYSSEDAIEKTKKVCGGIHTEFTAVLA